MADQINNQTADTTAQPVEPVQTTPITPKDIEGKTPEEIVKFVSEKSETLGQTTAELKALKDYQQQVNPVIETLLSDQELLSKVQEAHQKRLGITSEPQDTKKEDKTVPQSSDDTRKAVEAQIVGSFERQYGIDKLEPTQQQEIRLKVGQELADIVGNNTISLEKLPKLMEKAYFWATKDEIAQKAIETAKAEAQQQATGVISSIPSSSVNPSDVTLSQEERAVAQMMGVSEEKWLQRKQELAEKKGRRP